MLGVRGSGSIRLGRSYRKQVQPCSYPLKAETPKTREQMAEEDLEWYLQRDQLINDSMLNITLPPGINLANQNKTVGNYNVPLPVYVAVPVLTALISACLIYGFCWWKMRLVRRRKTLLEKQNIRRRRSSLKPGSSERGKKFGLTRAIGPDGDPLIIPKDKVLSLARTLDDVEQRVLSYQSLGMGDRLPEKQEYKVKEDAYSIAINPMFSTLQSGAMGYVLGGDDKPDEGSDPHQDSGPDATSRRKTNLKLSSQLEAINTTALPRLSQLKLKGDAPQRGGVSRKSLIKEVQREAEEQEESSVDASSLESEASSPTSLDTESREESSEGESDDEPVKKPVSPKSPTVSSLSTVKSASELSPLRASFSAKPLSTGPELSSARTKSSNPSVVSPQGKVPVPSRAPRSTNSVEDSSDAESSEESPTVKSPTFGKGSTKANLSSKSSKAGDSNEEGLSGNQSLKSPKARDSGSPFRKSFSASPRASSASKAPVDSGDMTPRSSSASRASKVAVDGEDTRTGSVSPFASSSGKSFRKSSVNPRFSDGTRSDKDFGEDSSKKSNWNPNTVPARPSIKKSVSSKSPGTGPFEPYSPFK
ncbi:hypothetical protein R1flu_029245 [Riccia fluitans]|uniref:Uncharacterized protein n=1 Tax=Riccia fluitans TaxID=41844 RepID=A0ABD1XNY7_9MARC